MKRIIGLLLVLTMLMGIVGVTTTAAAADAAKTVPTLTNSVDGDGNVSVKVSTGDKDFTYAYTNVYVGNTRYGVSLEYDSEKGAYVGQREEAANGTVVYVNLEKYKWNDDNTVSTNNDYYWHYSEKGKPSSVTLYDRKYTYQWVEEEIIDEDGSKHTSKYQKPVKRESDEVSQNYNEETGKISSESHSVSSTDLKRIKYEYKNAEGETVKTTTDLEVKGKSEQETKEYNSETGKLSSESHTTSEFDGDEKKRTTNSTQEDKYYNSETGKLSSESTSATVTTAIGKVRQYESYGNYGFLTESKETSSEEKNYNSDGEYTGKHEYAYVQKYDTTGTEATEISKTSNEKQYNKSDVLTSETDYEESRVYNTAKTAYTYNYNGNTKNYGSTGLLSNSSENVITEEYKEVESEYGYTYWKRMSRKENAKSYNRDGVLSNERIEDRTYGTDDSYTEKITNREYNTFYKAMTKETINTTKRDADYNYKYAYTTTQNNDAGSLRYKRVQNEDGSEVHYNSKGSVVATRDKNDLDGTWKDASGKVIGKNYSKEDGSSESTDVYFSERYGEITGWSISKTTVKDGVTTKTESYYKDGKLDSETVRTTGEDGSVKRTVDGVVRYTYDPEKYQESYYDYKGNLSDYSVYNPEDDTYTSYNYAGKITYKWGPDENGIWTDWSYDSEGNVYEYSQDVGNTQTYYSGDGKLKWSRSYSPEDDAYIYKDKDGKEFARTFYKNEKDEYKDGTQTRAYTQQKIYWNDVYDPDEATVSLEKEEYNYTSTNKDNAGSSKRTRDYTKWSVVNGKEQDKVTRKEVETTSYDDTYSETLVKKDGILTRQTYAEKNEYGGTEKRTVRNYDWFTGKPTSTYKYIYSDVADDPVSYQKYYDKYGNLQTYTVTDDTDEWDWRFTYYANGIEKQEFWEDELDYDSAKNVEYFLDGNKYHEYTQNGNTSTDVYYNRDGSWSYWADKVDGVTNAWEYDGKGNLTGYRWNQKSVYAENDSGSEEVASSYEWWDAAGTLIYTYMWENLADGYTETWTDPAGNKLEYKGGEVTLTTTQKADGWCNLFGSWFYVENGKPVTGDWKQIGGTWYYFNYQGKMRSGTVASSTYDDYGPDKVYALDNNGALATGGWTQLNDAGTSWAYTNENGEVLTGWQQIGGKWYYFTEGWNFNKDVNYKDEAEWSRSSSRGRMVTGAVKIWNSDWETQHTYFFNEDGTWDTTPGWKIADDYGEDVEYHYYDKNGKEVTGWNKIDGKWYYFNEDGVLRNGWVKDGPSWYFMDPAQKGAMATDGWVEDKYEDWYYVNADGSMKTGWVLDNGTWYYMNADGAMAHDEWVGSGSDWYYMDANGQIETGWLQKGKTWYYLDEGGLMVTGWKFIGGTWYYFNSDGSMKHDSWLQDGGSWYYLTRNGSMAKDWLEIDGQWELFDENGVWQYTWDGE